jgi:carboxymethylenebutenolidase
MNGSAQRHHITFEYLEAEHFAVMLHADLAAVARAHQPRRIGTIHASLPPALDATSDEAKHRHTLRSVTDRGLYTVVIARSRDGFSGYRGKMCFELDSLPAIPPLSGGAPVISEDVTLEAADGTRFAAFAALPDEPAPAGVVVLPDVRGLYRFYEELALRFAERGYPAIAIDYFGRTAGVGKRDDEFPFMEHVAQTTPEGIQQDTRAAVEYLRSPEGPACTTVFTVGFCFGGRNAWLAAAGGHGLAGAVGFYGSTGERNGQPGPTQRAAEFEAPILALQAGADEHILPEHNTAFEAALAASGVEYELVVYEGAPHSFFDRRYQEFAEASADAWERVLAFIARHIPSGR